MRWAIDISSSPKLIFKWSQNKLRTMSLQFSVGVSCGIISSEITNSSQYSYWLILSISTLSRARLSIFFSKNEISTFKSKMKSFAFAPESFSSEIVSLFSFCYTFKEWSYYLKNFFYAWNYFHYLIFNGFNLVLNVSLQRSEWGDGEHLQFKESLRTWVIACVDALVCYV